MPELPEVENVKLSLELLGLVGLKIVRVELRRANLRTPLKPSLRRQLIGQSLRKIERRAKFLIFDTEDYLVLSHLGMTGSWRQVESDSELGTHDHVLVEFESGLLLVFNDPRRFGLLEHFAKKGEAGNRWLDHLGVEPLERDFTDSFLFERTRRRKGPIKSFIMDQRQVVGVGNIYASEALFRAGVKPLRPAGRLTMNEAVKLAESIRAVLIEAIAAGGSTIKDYRNSRGEKGEFQQRFAVYDRSEKPCLTCGAPIRARAIAGRNTFWCPKCQR